MSKEMNKNQWAGSGTICWILMIVFIIIDNSFRPCLNIILGTLKPLSTGDIWCIVNNEMYDPFIYLFFTLAVICSVVWLGFVIWNWLEKKNE